MKIGLLTDSDAFAGTERHMLDLACSLRDLSCEVTLLCPKKSMLADRARSASLGVMPLEKGLAVSFPAVRQLAALFHDGRFDLVHAHNGRMALHAAFASTFAGKGRLVATQHFIHPARATRKALGGLLMSQAHRWAGRKIDHVIAISDAVRTAALAREEIQPRKITVVPNGITDPVHSPLRPAPAVRADLGIAPETPLITTVARLEKEKGLSTLVEALRISFQSRPKAVCFILGEGSMRAALETKIAQAGLQGSIRLLGFQQDVFSLVNASNFFVLPSPDEPFGLAVVEAMGLSKAVIAARAGGPAEIIQDGQSGLLCTPTDATDFARAIVLLAGDPALQAAMGERGRARFRERYTAPRMAANTLEIYRNVLR